MKGRYIGENLRLLYDVLVYTNFYKMPGLLLAVDFEKAFDSVAWSFIKKSLDRFNFGPDIKRWVQRFYTSIKASVAVNSQYTSWFQIERSVRQGDPLSPYPYLICAEIMSLMIRQNPRIKGILVKDTSVLLPQFTDDTTLYLDGKEQSFRESVNVLVRFASMPGLKINFDKTSAVWIGSEKDSRIRFLPHLEFKWNPATFKVLGVHFSTNTEIVPSINYEGKLLEIQKLLNAWSKRHLTPLGKIAVIKSLVVSKITYLTMNIPDPTEGFIQELEKMLLDFFYGIWQER